MRLLVPLLQVKSEVQRVQSLMQWGKLPLLALGVAEGGAMALVMAHHMKLQVSLSPLTTALSVSQGYGRAGSACFVTTAAFVLKVIGGWL